MSSTSYEARVILATEAVQNNKKTSIQAAAKIYNVADRTIRRRLAGRLSRRDTTPNSRRLNQSEEEAIIRYVLELGEQSFPPRLSGVEDIANQLLRVHDAPPVGKVWAHNFVKR